MKVKRLKKIKILSSEFSIVWDKSHRGGSFAYAGMEINIGTKSNNESEIFMILCHEIFEAIAEESSVRMQRPDCETDYLFVYDHRQHETMMSLFAGTISQFIGG